MDTPPTDSGPDAPPYTAPSGGLPDWTTIDLSALTELQDPASILGTITSGTVQLLDVSGGTSMASHIAVLVGDTLTDGLYEFSIERTNSGANDKAGAMIGVIDSGNVAQPSLVGFFEAAGGEERNHALGGTVQSGSLAGADTATNVVRVLSGNIYDMIGVVNSVVIPATGFSHTVSGSAKLAVAFRRGSSPGAAHTLNLTVRYRKLT